MPGKPGPCCRPGPGHGLSGPGRHGSSLPLAGNRSAAHQSPGRHLRPEVIVLGLAGSPRKRGNTRLLLDRVLEGARSGGGHTEMVDLCQARIAPCIACDGCLTHQRCVVQDDFQGVFDKLLLADRIVLATPVYFMGVSAQAKRFIDRCQCLWARKYIQNLPVPAPQGGGVRRGHLISVGGSGGETLFQCAEKTFKYFLDTLDAEMGSALLYREVDERGEIAKHHTAWDDAFSLGEWLVSPSS